MLADRVLSEQVFHDRQAAERAKHFAVIRNDLRFDDDVYLDHETWIRPAIALLGPLKNRTILDFGCGHGMAATILARAGASVHAFDLSPGYVIEARERATANNANVQFTIANGESLPYADRSFDAIWGCAILHHLNLSVAGREIQRVLKPGGVAVFCEPWDGNRWLAFARKYLPYPGKHRTIDEQPLTPAMLAELREIDPSLQVLPHQWLGMIGRVWRNRRLSRVLARIDAQMFSWFPFLRKQCRYVVVVMKNTD
jgi:ubiquinone/menaquinone biosynthesis C-methylase UbiE